MCGIVGYVGQRGSVDVLLGGLKRLEYRGYDSAGVAVLAPSGELGTAKRAGKLSNLTSELETHPIVDGHTGIGHTAGRRTAAPPTRTRIRTWATAASWHSFTTASSRTSAS